MIPKTITEAAFSCGFLAIDARERLQTMQQWRLWDVAFAESSVSPPATFL